MITINKSHRRSSILVDMLSTNYTPSINVLTKRFRVSRRSIRNDLDEIEKFLQKNLSTTLIFDKSGIIYPDLREVKTQALLEVIDSLNKSDITKGLTKEQRISAILASLILVEKFITIDSISEKLDVSRNTVVNDLKSLKGNLSYYKLELISKPRLGIALEGLEKDRRIAYVKLLRESLSTNQYLNLSLETFTDELDDVHTFPSILYNELFRKLDMRLVVGTCKSIQKSLVARISDIALSNLVIGLAITMHRAKPGQHCDSADYLLKDFVQSPTYQIVKEYLDNISNQVSIQVSPEDVCFIVQCVLFSNLLDNSYYPDQLPYVTQRLILGNLITAVSSEVGFDFSLDENLVNSLEEEVIPILYRTQHDVSFRYPYIDEIKRSYPNIFIAVQKHTLPLKLFLQLGITEDETALLTMHFIASFINTKRNSVKPRVVVVCGTGLGSSNLLVANLNQVYELDILAVTSLQDLSGVLEVHLPDFIITTIPLDAVNVPSVCVSPFLNSSDSSAVSKLISLTKTKTEDLRINTLARETDNYNSLGLLDVLSPLSIDLDYNASDFSSAISRSGELLSNQGIITHEYTNSMVELYESIGPYIVFTKGVALAHSNKMEYVDRTGVSLVRLSSPVESGHPENDPVDVLFAFATPSPTSHSRVIIELGKLISSDGVQRIRLAKTPDEVLRFIEEVLEND